MVLVNGRIEGTWTTESKRSKTIVKIEMFGRATDLVEQEIAVEARSVSDFLNGDVELA